MRPIKIAYILTPIDFGGAEKVSLTFLQHVNRSNFQLRPIVLVRPWETTNIFLQALNAENYAIDQVPVALKPRSKGRDYFRLIRSYRIIHSFLKKGSFDLVHTHGYFADIVGIPAAKILGIPHISTCHGFISNDRKLKYYNKLDRFALRFADRIIAVSEEIKHDLINSGVHKSNITLIQNAVKGNHDDKLFFYNRHQKRRALNLSEEEFVIGYVGRLSQEKGVKYLIQASLMLNESGLPVKVVIIGEGPQRTELEDLVKKANIGDNVIFAGFQGNVEHWLPAIDVFVLPSLTEGTPMALLEAMTCGIPVVASAVGGVPRVIDSGENGILVSPGKPEEIKNAIQCLFKSKALRNAVSEAAQETIKLKYNIEDWTKKIETEYLRLMNVRLN